LSSGEKVLDIGCGPGFLCEEMSKIVGGHGAWSALISLLIS
jgi:ubiquinone/menaquinone biosynthesis C-methylase UbiE